MMKYSNNHFSYSWRDIWRYGVHYTMMGILFALTIVAVLLFFSIMYYLLLKGGGAIDWDFFTHLPSPAGESGGGVANGLIGSTLVVGLASLVGVPWGIGVGVYLNEYKHTLTARVLRLVVDLLISVPSIVVGIFIYGLVVTKYGFSSYAGAGSLFVIMLPVVIRGTEEILRMIPYHIREAGLALGLPRWKVIMHILLPGVLSMLITIVMLAIARIAGETAPLLFTALGNQFHIKNLKEPIATLPVQIYEFSKSGFEHMENQAWAGALVLVSFVFAINLLTRVSLFIYKTKSIKRG